MAAVTARSGTVGAGLGLLVYGIGIVATVPPEGFSPKSALASLIISLGQKESSYGQDELLEFGAYFMKAGALAVLAAHKADGKKLALLPGLGAVGGVLLGVKIFPSLPGGKGLVGTIMGGLAGGTAGPFVVKKLINKWNERKKSY